MWYDLNGDGIQDPNEPGVAGVVVELRQGNTVIATTTTDANGLYLFENVAPGLYSVVFRKPDGYDFSPARQGSDPDLDSNVVDFATGTTDIFLVLAGSHIRTIDAGLRPGLPPPPMQRTLHSCHLVLIVMRGVGQIGVGLA